MDEIKIASNRSFGLVFFIVFLLIALYPLTYSGEIRIWSAIISLIFLILGDNLFHGEGLNESLLTASKEKIGADIFVYPVKDPQRYGVVEFDEKFEVGEVDKARVLASNIRTDTDVTAAGPVYRVFLTASSVTPEDYRTGTRDGNGVFYLNSNFLDYPEGYLAMEVRIFAEDPGPTFKYNKLLQDFADLEPLFTYNTAIVR